MAVTCQYKKGSALEEILLDIVQVRQRHGKENPAIEFIKILEEFEIIEKILLITCNNATNNNVMIEKMGEALTEFQGDCSQVRCFAHVVNLVAKSVIAQFDLPHKNANSAANHEKRKKQSAVKGDDNLDKDGYEVSGWENDNGSDVAIINDILAGSNRMLASELKDV
ncbi:hypothetical protein C0991_012279 [Blastosporella zonata]|nr:hypothetical protein C0991_012279 [Blastosporella zonata]